MQKTRRLRQVSLLQSNFGAQRALLKSGQTVGGRLMVGVKPLEGQHRAAADSLSKAAQPQVTAPVRPVTIRPYKLDGSNSQVRRCSIQEGLSLLLTHVATMGI